MAASAHSDDDMCQIIWSIRQQYGACTLGELVKVTGLTKPSLSARLSTLRKRGLVRWDNGVHGSIRTADEVRRRAGRPVREIARVPQPKLPVCRRNLGAVPCVQTDGYCVQLCR